MNSPRDVAPETQAEDLEESLEVVENDKANLELPVVLEVVLPWLVVHCVPEKGQYSSHMNSIDDR